MSDGKRQREEVGSLKRIHPAVQNYAWGVQGGGVKGLVARMAGAPEEDGKPYAELWMGTHPSAPSKVFAEGGTGPAEDLSVFLEANPAFAGGKLVKAQLPYLFKCLSVRCPLSIQAHPDKRLAEELHKGDPTNYKDDNHKPELACAVSEFQGLCGFRPLEEIAQHLSEIPELKAIVGETAADMVVDGVSGDAKAQSKALKAAFEALMSADETRVREETTKLIRRINEKPSTERSAADCVVLSANEDFPGDVGLLSVYMLNVVKLQPGDGMFLKPNFPHAYLKGDCVELMATSDNVVRAGFTPKFKDVSTLVTMLEYDPAPPHLMEGKGEGPNVWTYIPPSTDFPEFALRRVVLGEGKEDAFLCTSACPRIAICISGGANMKAAPPKDGDSRLIAGEMEMKTGNVVVCAANVLLSFSLLAGAGDTLVFVSCCHPCFES